MSAAGAPLALAQSDANGSAAEQSQNGFSDAELRSFAAAAVAVHDIRNAFLLRAAAVSDEDELEQLKRAAAAHMTAAVQQQGMSVARFAEILGAAQNDDALASRINEQLNAPESTREQQ